MSHRDLPGRVFVTAWAFQVPAEHQREFERAYGSSGDWVRLFRTADGYIRTELHRDPKSPDAYITLDFWRSREQYDGFKQRARSAYQEIDAKCERLTQGERLLAEFADLGSVRVAFPQLGPLTQVRDRIRLRAAEPADIPAIIQIERAAALAAHWTESAYSAMFTSNAPRRVVLLAEDREDRLCGVVVARIAADECELENIVVLSKQMRQGIGSRLLQTLLQTVRARGIRRISLEVRESNNAARGLYEKLGFQQEGRREGYYSAPQEAAVLYSLSLITDK